MSQKTDNIILTFITLINNDLNVGTTKNSFKRQIDKREKDNNKKPYRKKRMLV